MSDRRRRVLMVSAMVVRVVMFILGIIAIIAIIGLIPLFAAVYAAYVQEPYNRSGLLPTLAPRQVRMPDLVGLEENIAKSALENMGLGLVVQAEEPHPQLPAFTIITQTIPAGQPVNPGTSVGVVVSQGPPLIELPDVVGLPYDAAAQQLGAVDLVAQKYEDWSPEPLGSVVSQDPPAGSLVANRTLIILVVSSGSRVPVGANLGGQILLRL